MDELHLFKSSAVGKQLAEQFLIMRRASHDVYICFSRSTTPLEGNYSPDAPTNNRNNILKHLVAVKVDTPALEVSLLRQITNHIQEDKPGTQRTTRYLASGICHDEYQNPITWISMPALSSCLTVDHIMNLTSEPIPRAFVFHFFLQMLDALTFLHSTCGIVHKDLHFQNVMLDILKQDIPGLPNLILIDFGNSEATKTASTFRWERGNFCMMVGELVVHGTDCAVCKRSVVMWDISPHGPDDVCKAIGSGKEIQALFACVKEYLSKPNCPSLEEMQQAMRPTASEGRLSELSRSYQEIYALMWEPVRLLQGALVQDAVNAIESEKSGAEGRSP